MNAAVINILRLLALTFLILNPFYQSALAYNEDWISKPTPEYISSDGNVTFKLKGRVYWDQNWGSDKNGTMNFSDNEFKAARLGFSGKINNVFGYNVEANLSGSDIDFTSLYVSFKGAVEFRFGNYKLATSLEELTSSRYTTFMVRGAFTDAFGFSRGFGASIFAGGDDWTLHAGVQKGSINKTIDDGTLTIAGRYTKALTLNDSVFHLGASLRYREQDEVQSDLTYSQRAFSHQADKFLNTNSIADRDLTYGLEAAFLKGSFAIQSEVSVLTAHLSNRIFGQDDPTFKGGYIDLSWFLTGEQRSYDPKKGSFGGIKPLNPTGEGGRGAFQLALRLDTVDLNDQGIWGGSQTSIIAGLNWYPNRWTRIMVNYSNSTINNGFLVLANGLTGHNKVHTFGTRLQINW